MLNNNFISPVGSASVGFCSSFLSPVGSARICTYEFLVHFYARDDPQHYQQFGRMQMLVNNSRLCDRVLNKKAVFSSYACLFFH